MPDTGLKENKVVNHTGTGEQHCRKDRLYRQKKLKCGMPLDLKGYHLAGLRYLRIENAKMVRHPSRTYLSDEDKRAELFLIRVSTQD